MRLIVTVLLVACAGPKQPVEPMAPLEPDNGLISEPKQVVTPPPRTECSLRLAAEGVQVDGDWMKPDHAVSVCKTRSVAIVELTASADLLLWERMRTELEAARVQINLRGEKARDACIDTNPLAKGCPR